MSGKYKILNKAKKNPSGLSFSDFNKLLKKCGWDFKRQEGSHIIWQSPKGVMLPIQKRKDGNAKSYQVRQFLKIEGK